MDTEYLECRTCHEVGHIIFPLYFPSKIKPGASRHLFGPRYPIDSYIAFRLNTGVYL